QEADRHVGRDLGVRPAGRLGDRLQEDGEREHGANRDAGHERTERNHHPSVARIHFFFFFTFSACITGLKRPFMRPSGSVKRDSHPMPGISCSSTWILPPAFSISRLYFARSSTAT